MKADAACPLDGVVVLDLSRMLPGAVLARRLMDLGARVVKVEDPSGGDPMRAVPPLVDGIGIGFAALYAGAESVSLDLAVPADAERLRRMAARTDLLVESFRPGTLDRWGIGPAAVTAANPRLVWCSLSSFGPSAASPVAHDLNLAGLAGLVDLSGGVPPIQVADVGAGLLAASAVLAALLARERTGKGAVIDQPLAAGPLPFLAWSLAEAALDRERVVGTLLGGACPCYRTYRSGDGGRVTVACLEPKFWLGFCDLIERPDLAGAGFAFGPAGEEAAAEVEAVLAKHPRDEWLGAAAEHGLPVAAVHTLDEALEEPLLVAPGLIGRLPLPGGAEVLGVGPLTPALGRPASRPAPKLGEHTKAVLAELGGE